MSAYKNAIDLTMDTIGNRAKSYRNLVVAVVMTGLCSFAWAVASWSVSPLSGLIMLVPVCSLFFHMDGRILNRWQSALLGVWARREIELRYFRDAVCANPAFPKVTVHGMLATLPAAGGNVSDQGMSQSTREAVAAFVTFIHSSRIDALAFMTVLYAIAGASLPVAANTRNWRPLLGMIALVLIPLVRKMAVARRIGKARDIIDDASGKADFDREKYLEAVSQFQEDPFANDLLT